jgi:hypothetical protein
MKGLKIVFSYFLTLSLTVGSVSASVQAPIAEAFEKFNYSMNVEWDQEDEEFAKKAETELLETLTDLEESGVSTEDIIKHVESNMLKGRLQAEYQTFLKAIKAQKLSQAEVTVKTLDFIEKNSVKGTNFYGEGAILHHKSKFSLIVTVVAVVIVTQWVLKKHHHHDHH